MIQRLQPFGRQSAAQRSVLFGLFALSFVVMLRMRSIASVIGISRAEREFVEICFFALIVLASLSVYRNFGRGMSIAYRATVLWIMLAWMARLLDVGLTYHLGGLLSDLRFARANPLIDDLFPSIFRSQFLLVLGFALPAITGSAALVWDSMRIFRINAVTLMVCSLTLMLHQHGFANQMFTTAFWVSLWLLWLSTRCPGVNDELSVSELLRGAFLAQCIVSFIYFGAFVGKCTGAYWSGEIFGNLHFPVYVWYRRLAEDYLWLPPLYGRLAIIGEGFVAFLVFVSPRFALPLSLFVVMAMLSSTTWTIVQAVGPVLGIACAGIFMMRELRGRSASTSQVEASNSGSD